MKGLRSIAAALCVWSAMSCVAVAATTGAGPSTKPAISSASLRALVDRTWERSLSQSPEMATYIGDTRFNDRWSDLSPTAIESRYQDDQRTLTALIRIARDKLSAADQLNYDLFKRQLEERIASHRFKPWIYEFSMRGGPQNLNEIAGNMPFDTVADYEKWLSRLRALPAHLAQVTVLLRAAAVEGRTQPRVIMQRVVAPLEAHAGATVETSAFMDRFRQYPASIPAREQERLTASARQIVGEMVIPAYQRFATFFRDEYLPKCRESIGIWDTPDGLAFYDNRAAFHTTTNLTAAQIHEIGLKEVARILAEMQIIMDRVGWKGSREAFFEFLRTDPQFYMNSPATKRGAL